MLCESWYLFLQSSHFPSAPPHLPYPQTLSDECKEFWSCSWESPRCISPWDGGQHQHPQLLMGHLASKFPYPKIWERMYYKYTPHYIFFQSINQSHPLWLKKNNLTPYKQPGPKRGGFSALHSEWHRSLQPLSDRHQAISEQNSTTVSVTALTQEIQRRNCTQNRVS